MCSPDLVLRAQVASRLTLASILLCHLAPNSQRGNMWKTQRRGAFCRGSITRVPLRLRSAPVSRGRVAGGDSALRFLPATFVVSLMTSAQRAFSLVLRRAMQGGSVDLIAAGQPDTRSGGARLVGCVNPVFCRGS
jgi:hypothetical protein